MILETPRLVLRPFTPADAEDLYDYARDPRVGPIAGWSPHRSVEESREIIRTVFAAPHVFAVELRETGRVVGSVGLVGRHPMGDQPNGRGLMPEAMKAVLDYSFTQIAIKRVWCGHVAGNWRSARVIQKCGFHYCTSRTERHGEQDKLIYYYVLTGEDWRERISGAF